jgi:3-phenylpropionate/trans-cinnamate dioxygenase ferredoxin reductase component
VLSRVVVVGASLAGLRAAETLRTEGYAGSLTLVGAETHLPYDRPPLSKKLLAGQLDVERTHLRRETEYGDLDLELILGQRATALDLDTRRVTLADGTGVSYDGLVIATGAAPRRLPGQPELDGVFVLRTLDDSLALRAALDAGPGRVVVIGAGFIGAEVAATARGKGLAVTMVEALAAPLERALGAELGGVFADLHRDEGVDVRLGVGVAAIEGGERVERVRLSDGSVVAADVVVVGIGVAPVTDWLAGSGLELRDGVVADAGLAAGPPGVFAAGDVVRWHHELLGEEVRLEHWTNAAEQGAAAARNLLATAAGGDVTPYQAVPFFWSDQYDARIQCLGRPDPGDDVAIVHGSLAERRFVALYGRHGRLRGVLGVSLPKRVMPYRALLARSVSWDDALAHARAAEG